MSKQFISELNEKSHVHSIFLVKEKSLHTGKTGKAYLSLVVSDKTGEMDARIWDRAENWTEEFEIGDFIEVKGAIQAFQNRRQMVVSTLEQISPTQIELRDFLPSSPHNADEVYAELRAILEKIQNPFIKQLVFNTIEDPAILPLFKVCPAAKTIHHAYLGGLLDHVLSICKIMLFIRDHYGDLDLDLLLFGAVFHDIGKIWELNFETSIGYTDVGRLVGHIPMGSELVEKKASEIPNFPYELKNICKHLVLTHHGRLEYGSPKVPMTLEAFIVGYIDDLDSKINTLQTFVNSEKKNGSRWSRFYNLFERHFYLGTSVEK